MKKKILFLVIAFIVGFSFLVNNVSAEGVPDLASSVTFYKATLNADVTKDPRVSNTFYKYVYDASKKHAGIAYCIHAGLNNPPEGSTVNLVSDITSARLLYILQHGYSAINGQISMGDLTGYSEHQAYYITQLAVWMYFGPTGGGYATDHFTQNNPMVVRALQLYKESEGATSNPSNPWIGNGVASFELHYDAANKRYISDQMHVVGYVFDHYTITLTNAPAGTKLIKENGEEFASGSTFEFKGNDDNIVNGNYYIVVPESSVSGDVSNIALTVSANTYFTKVLRYDSPTPNLQPLAVLVPVNDTISETQYYSLKYVKEDCPKKVEDLIKKYPKNRNKKNASYMSDLNAAKKKYPEMNTDAGVENPRCSAPTCEEVLAYLKKEYAGNLKESNTEYKNEIDSLKGKYNIYLDAGYENPSCGLPSCEDALKHLADQYPKCDPNDKEYQDKVKDLKTKYVIYGTDICNISCSPKKVSCYDELAKLLAKYPNPADRNKNNVDYVRDVDAIVKLGQENGFTFYTDDFANPDCVKKNKREVRIRKLGCDADGVSNCYDLPGATLVIKNSKGEIIREWQTDGTVKVFTDLEPGTYTVVETVIPAGYNAGPEKTFTITNNFDDDYLIEVEPIINTRPPETADINFTLIITAFILFLGFGIFGLIKTSQREEM